MAGAGPDGVLVHQMLGAHKSVLGRMAYYLHAARIFASYRFHPFQVELTDAQSGIIETHRAVSVMAVRVDDLGGLFSRLVRRSASVHQSSLEIILLRPPAFLSLPLWFAFGWLGLNRLNPFLLHANVSGFACPAGNGAGPHFQADGEWIGRVPICVSLVPDALRILIPS
jgi:diacylglycerol kinase family enzyme